MLILLQAFPFNFHITFVTAEAEISLQNHIKVAGVFFVSADGLQTLTAS
jgi:hypothetical protein